MRRFALAAFLLCAAAPLAAVAPRPGNGTHTVKLNGQTFTLPAGFTVELAAGPPLVERPIVADFDDAGRLYVGAALGSNEPVEVQLRKKPYRIVRFEDSTGSGRFDRAGVFADKIMFPEGARWIHGSLYVAAPPSIWKLTDTRGAGVADKRIEWFKGKTLTRCANDLHGPYLGPDGWVYWCKGAFAEQTYPRPGRRPLVTKAAHIFRARPDGSGVEPVMTGGMDNPVAVAFTPGGERILTTTFLQRPGGGLRDGLIHAIYGGVYGQTNNVLDGHPWTAPTLMPVLTHMGAAAPAGVLRYESDAFGREYKDNLFAALFNLHKVTRHVLEPDGATFKTRDIDFLVSDSFDFHPTDVVEDADGSLLVIDTGGWYKLCCPTSQLPKPDVLGGIYRVRRTDAPRTADPRGRKLTWAKASAAELARRLDDARSAVRRRAVETLAARGAGAVPALAEVVSTSRSAEARRNAVWTATRIDHADARAAVRRALGDGDELVRQAALHSVSVWRDHVALPALLQMLRGKSAHNRRAAAEALGRLGDRAAVPATLEAVGQPADRALEHSLTFALIEIADRTATEVGLASKEPRTRRAALVALDQMEGGGVKAENVVAELASPEPALKQAAAWVVGHHPEWGASLAGYFRKRLAAKEPRAAREELAAQLARFTAAPAVRKLLAERLAAAAAGLDERRTALRAMALSPPRPTPDDWVDALVQVLAAGKLVPESVAAARAMVLTPKRSAKLIAELLRVGESKLDDEVRLAALAAVPGGLAVVNPLLFDFLCERIDREEPVVVRALAAEVLARARLRRDQLEVLTGSLKVVGPMEVERLLDAFGRSTDPVVGAKLVAALKAAPVKSSLRTETLKPRLAKFGPKVAKEAEALYAALDVDAAKQKARLEELMAFVKGGDARRGQGVFNSAKAACYSCHAIGYRGGKVGPDLTNIGKIRSERDLLEAIVFPSASFVRSYEPVLVRTTRGKVHNGIVRKNTPEEVVLVLNATEEVRIARKDIEEMVPSKVSIMPAGVDQLLTPRELADLVAFLKVVRY
jgi:putative membrane-bound dehydrogenase-like protein